MSVTLYVTGFGPFAGVPDNPSSALAASLSAALRASAPPRVTLAPLAPLIVETSTAGADAAVAQLTSALASAEGNSGSGGGGGGSHTLLLSFGVAGAASGFALEAVAANEASFRVADERGLTLTGVPIDASEPLRARAVTTLPVAALAAALTGGASAGAPAVCASDDAGRFLCNWLFWRTLTLAAEARARGRPVHALFVHIPPLERVPAAAQLDFAQRLVAELADALTAGGDDYRRRHGGSLVAPSPPRPRLRSLPLPLGGAVAGGGGGGGDDDDEDLYEPLAAAQRLSESKSGGGGGGGGGGYSTGSTGSAAAAVDEATALETVLSAGFERGAALRALAATRDSGPPEEHAQRAVELILSVGDGEGEPAAAAAAAPAAVATSALAASSSSAARGEHKLVIAVRQDLRMSPGKIAAQCCHAALRAAGGAPAPLLRRWQSQGEPIVVLRVEDEPALRALQAAARARGLAACTVRDAGRTQVEAGTTTVLALGPAPASDVDAVSGELRLL